MGGDFGGSNGTVTPRREHFDEQGSEDNGVAWAVAVCDSVEHRYRPTVFLPFQGMDRGCKHLLPECFGSGLFSGVSFSWRLEIEEVRNRLRNSGIPGL